MRGLHKSIRVSWPSDESLCQVKLFLSEESPSQVGFSSQDHLQEKTSYIVHPAGVGSDENLPPGFGETCPENQLKNQLSQITLTKWKCPPRFVLNINWQVVSGEESKDVEVQNHREMRVLEAIYPRPSSIPPNSSVSMDVENSLHSDQATVQIPITPIEEEDGSVDTQPDQIIQEKIPTSNIVSQNELGIGLVNSQGNLIDHNLLIKFLTNPNPTTLPDPPSFLGTSNGPQIHHPLIGPIGLIQRSETNSTTLRDPLPFPDTSNGCISNFSVPSQTAKDFGYYKSLIRKHGDVQDQECESNNNQKRRDLRPKINRPCMYFNSSKGCRNGDKCAFQHEVLPQKSEAKRMKIGEVRSTESCSF